MKTLETRRSPTVVRPLESMRGLEKEKLDAAVVESHEDGSEQGVHNAG